MMPKAEHVRYVRWSPVVFLCYYLTEVSKNEVLQDPATPIG